MFWDKKKKGSLPDLPHSPATAHPRLHSPPSLQTPPEMNDDLDEETVHELPSFPDSPMQRGFSQAAIKDAITNDEIPDYHTNDIPENKFKVMEMSEWEPKPLPTLPSAVKREKPIFVRVDKFQVARNSLENVKTKLNEIEILLKQIRDVKAKEDQELSSWESEMENIKSRIQSVITDIFDKAED